MNVTLAGPFATPAGLILAIALGTSPAVEAQIRPEPSGAYLHRSVQIAIERAGPDALALAAASQSSADDAWARVIRLAPGTRVAVHLRDASATRGQLVATTADGVTLRTSHGEQSTARSAIRKITVPDPGRRMLFGILGIAGGAVAGFLVCPQCANEGSSGTTTTNVGLGAAAGAAAFLIAPSRTVYEAPDR